ncbi:MAG: SpoIIE family protein phosphatase [Crocinitomix sp.]|nr:SpoIIE family protein phosphatase [Crocinitomix sp.]
MRIYIAILLLLELCVVSCVKDQESITETENSVKIEEPASFLDSIETGVPLPIFLNPAEYNLEPKIIPIGAPYITQANENIYSIQSPGIALVSDNLTTFTPGDNTTLLPEVSIPVAASKQSAFPKVTAALPPTATDAAYYNLQYLDVDQGLSSSYVMDIIEDSRGNLWVSTWASGVCMYNSRTFTNYDKSSGLLTNYIWSIFEDSKGNIWFGSDGSGVSRFDGNSFVNFSVETGLAGSIVKDILEDERGNIWFATNNGITKFDGSQFYTYREENGLGGNSISDIHLGMNNRILITTENGFSIFDGVLFTHFSQEDGLLSNNTSAIYEDTEGNIWIGFSDAGICLFDGYTFFTFDESHGLAGNSVTSILEDDYNRIWIGSANNGLTIYDRSQFIQIGRPEGLSSNTVRSIFQDSNLNMWIGTNGGLNKYNERSFRNYTEEQGLGGLVVRGIAEDPFGNLWFGHSNGASKYNGHTYENYGAEQGLTDHIVRVITQDHKGNIWFGTEGDGAIYFDGTQFMHYTVENGLSGNTILSMYEDSDYNMWFGTVSGGLSKFNGDHFEHLTMEEGLTSNTIRAICEDNDKNMWFGTNAGGLEKFDGQMLTHYTEKEGLSLNTVLSLMLDTEGRLWIGTESAGVNVMLKDKFISINQKNGLSNDIIWSIVEDYENNIWVGTEKGLNHISIAENNTYGITNYNKLDGLKGVDFYPNSVLLDSENRLWWGTGKALSTLDLNKYEKINSAPTLSITNILIKEAVVDYRGLKTAIDTDSPYEHKELSESQLKKVKYDSVYKFTNLPSNIEVPYDLNHLTIQFSANDWTAPHKIKYVHKLEGASNEWHTMTDDNKVVHSYLPEGDYVFHVKAIGEAEIWSETLTFNITVRPPWWKTVWAYLFYFIFGSSIIVFITAFRTKKLLQQRKRLEKLVTERTEEVVRQKELVESKNKEIIDSINYAKRIQRAVLPSSGMVKRKLGNALVLFKPKDIVAGDFYWLDEKKDTILLAAADCTGHGVPGAMVSLVCNNTLSRTVREFNLTNPALILNKVRDIVIESFTSSREEVKDGMDIALVSLNIKTNMLQYAGANNNLYVVSDGKIQTFKADRQPIGKYVVTRDFSLQEIQLKPGDSFYMLTDGYVDQFGGPNGKKFKSKRFLQILLDIQHLTMLQQQKYLDNAFVNWKGDLDQIDDVCVLGVKI